MRSRRSPLPHARVIKSAHLIDAHGDRGGSNVRGQLTSKLEIAFGSLAQRDYAADCTKARVVDDEHRRELGRSLGEVGRPQRRINEPGLVALEVIDARQILVGSGSLQQDIVPRCGGRPKATPWTMTPRRPEGGAHEMLADLSC